MLLKIVRFRRRCAFALILGSAAGAHCSPAWGNESPLAERLHFFRFLEDYADITPEQRATDWFAAIKKIPLGREETYLTLGGDYRYRYENFENALFGLTPLTDYEQHLSRFMLHADVHAGPAFRAFVQLSAFTEDSRSSGPGPFDESDPDVQQAFADIGTKEAMLRIGRQEIVLGSGKLTDIREGPNQRQSFDAARATVTLFSQATLDVFYGRDVLPDRGAFSDSSEDGTEFWGAYGSKLLSPWAGASFDAYYFGIGRPDAIYQAGVSNEERHSLGARVNGSSGPFSYEYEGIYQFGRFGGLDISAWGVRTEHYWALPYLPFSPRIGLIANATSGDGDPSDGTLGTFDALFPNPAYTTDAAIFRPRNFYELHPVVSLDVSQNFNLLFEWNFLWRVETDDAVYAVPGFPLVPGPASDERYIGNVFDVIATWRLSSHMTLQASYVHAMLGDVIKDAGGEDIDFALFQTMLKF